MKIEELVKNILFYIEDDYISDYVFSEEGEVILEVIKNEIEQFTQFHINKALIKASEIPLKEIKYLCDDPKEGDDAYCTEEVVDKEAILNCYNIKDYGV